MHQLMPNLAGTGPQNSNLPPGELLTQLQSSLHCGIKLSLDATGQVVDDLTTELFRQCPAYRDVICKYITAT